MSIKWKDFDILFCVLPLLSYLLVSSNSSLHQNKLAYQQQIYHHQFLTCMYGPPSLSANTHVYKKRFIATFIIKKVINVWELVILRKFGVFLLIMLFTDPLEILWEHTKTLSIWFSLKALICLLFYCQSLSLTGTHTGYVDTFPLIQQWAL